MIETTHLAAGLLEKRKQIAAELKELQELIEQRRADLIRIDSTIALLDPEAAIPNELPTQGRRHRSGYFSQGELSRRCLDSLRRANGEPVSVPAIVTHTLEDKGLNPDDPRLKQDFYTRLQMAMHAVARQNQLVERVGKGRNTKWQITPQHI